MQPSRNKCKYLQALWLLPFMTIMQQTIICASESVKTYPLWDGKESVAEYAAKVNLPPTKVLDLGDGVKLELVLIPAGKFVMGTPKPEVPKETVAFGQSFLLGGGAFAVALLALVVYGMIRRRSWRLQYSLRRLLAFFVVMNVAVFGGARWWQTDKAWKEYKAAKREFNLSFDMENLSTKAYKATILKPFYMGRYEVKQTQYNQVMYGNPVVIKGFDFPVNEVTIEQAQNFCRLVGDKLSKCVRLPAENEWEYACRAGTTTPYYSGCNERDLAVAAWYKSNSEMTIHPVGEKMPNAFGLFDMHGNTKEWCFFYNYGHIIEPQNIEVMGLLRGGDYRDDAMDCRSAYRGEDTISYKHLRGGFRIVMELCSGPGALQRPKSQ